MSTKWVERELDELLEFSSGKSITPGGRGAYPAFGSNGIIGRSDESLFDAGIIIGRVGAYCGSIVISTSPFWASDNSIVARPKEGVDLRFAYFLLSNASLNRHAGGAAQPLLTQATLKPLRFGIPPLPTQLRIASVLGAYNDLIDVNRRRIALLEEMARRLFEEWFVSFRFPGHENGTIVETPEGPLPQGWHQVRLDEIARVNADTIRPVNAPERIGYVDIASVSRGEIQAIEWQAFSDAPGRARRRVRDGSTIWSMVRPNRRSHALVVDPEDNLIVSTGFAVLDPYGISSAYFYHYVTTDAFVGYLVGSASGAAYPAVTGATFERALVLLPPEQLDQEFSSVAGPMMHLVDALRKATMRLAASRDLLLPRLISGELSVSAAERELEAVA